MSEINSTKTKRICEFEGCGRKHYGKGLCLGHYQQMKKGQTLLPLYLKNRPDNTPPRIEYDESPCPRPDLKGPCHICRARKDKKGYAQVSVNGRMTRVHRYVWEQSKGPIESGKLIDHQCRVRACCNVDHLRIVTPKINALENSVSFAAKNATKTHCPHGHEYTPENTLVKRGSRFCRACYRLRSVAKKAGMLF